MSYRDPQSQRLIEVWGAVKELVSAVEPIAGDDARHVVEQLLWYDESAIEELTSPGPDRERLSWCVEEAALVASDGTRPLSEDDCLRAADAIVGVLAQV